MLKFISRFCTRFPIWVIIAISLITAFFAYQMATNLEFDGDVMKSMPSDIEAAKSDDYYKKNFNYQETMLIGVERKEGPIMEVDVLRKIEAIILDIKNLKGTKTFQSKLAGKEVTLVQSIGIDTDDINSIANLEDAVMDKETGSVVSGSVIKKLKKDHGIGSKPGEEELLPKNRMDLNRLIPDLTKRIMQDRSFRGNLLSEDGHASTISVPIQRKWDYKKRYAILELSTALDEDLMKSRFQGKESTFPFKIYGKTIDGIRIDDSFIADHVRTTRKKLSSWLKSELSDTAENDTLLKELLDGELTAENFKALMNHMEGRDFYMASTMNIWTNFMGDLWDFTLAVVDPFSRENLEFQMHNPKYVVDLEEVHAEVTKILEKHALEGVKYYVAGTPVVIAVMSSMMQEDLGTLLPIAILVVLVVLGLSFRSFRGVFIPAITVVLAVIWTMGLMAVLGIPLTSGTTMMPVILLGIGTAYGIHLLNRYNEDAIVYQDRKELVQNTVLHVGVAVVMAAITTIAGFSSLSASSLSMIQDFGIFSGVGIIFALVLSLTLTPSLLVLFRPPRHIVKQQQGKTLKESTLVRLLRNGSDKVVHHPKTVCGVLGIVFIGSAILATGNHFEGSMIKSFKEHNTIYQSDRFLNTNLTGTTNINLIFKFRDQINLDNPDAQQELKKRISGFSAAWRNLTNEYSELESTNAIITSLQADTERLPGSLGSIINRLTLVKDILNEEFIVESEMDNMVDGGDDMSALDGEETDSLDALDDEEDDLGGLGDGDMEEESDEPEGTFADLSSDQVAGLKDINRRMGLDDVEWENTATMVITLRKVKNSPVGVKMQRQLNLTSDFMAVDIKQPIVLNKLESLHHYLKNMQEPIINIDGKEYTPTGFVITPVDLVRKFYKVFYHNDDPAFDRLPDVNKDGFTDLTLTDRAINGVVLNQALNGSRDTFELMISPNLKEFQVQTMLRDGSSTIINRYLNLSLTEVDRLFPKDDPYIESVRIGGTAPTGMAINDLLSESQIQSILLSFAFVFIVTFFIFRSAMGGLFSLIPLVFTVVLNFGLIWFISGEINTATMMVASISIGTGVDYTIHFLERLKIQLRAGDNLSQAYINTVTTSGKAILVNATAVALGFLVLVFSVFIPQMLMGILMSATMLFASIGALVLLPAVILIVKPRYLTKLSKEEAIQEAVVPN